MPKRQNGKLKDEMMDSSVAALEYIFLAVLLAFIVGKLYSVLGKRTGNERSHEDAFSVRRNVETAPGGQPDNVVHLPRRNDAEQPAEPSAQIAPANTPLSRALMDIQLADRQFDPEGFLGGAKSAYEMIVTAYNAGDRKTLRGLVAPEVMEGFDAAIADRESRSETMDFTFIGFTSVKLIDASLVDRIAEITVKFVSEVISVKKNEDGAVIEGDPNTVVRVTDNWTFARDTRNSDPNWELVATAG